MIVDQLDLVAAALGPARVHALEHLGPVLALGAAGAGIDLDIGVVGVGLAGEQGRDLVLLRPLGELGRARRRRRRPSPRRPRPRPSPSARPCRPAPSRWRGWRRSPRRAGGARASPPAPPLGSSHRVGSSTCAFELVEPLQRAVPVEEAAQQVEGRPDLVDMGLRFGAHGRFSDCRHSGESRNPAALRGDEELDPGFRGNDELERGPSKSRPVFARSRCRGGRRRWRGRGAALGGGHWGRSRRGRSCAAARSRA